MNLRFFPASRDLFPSIKSGAFDNYIMMKDIVWDYGAGWNL